MYEELTAQARQAVTELLEAAKLKPGKIFVVGCSSSEMVGARIGKGSSLEAAQAAFAGIYPVLQAQGIELAVQCCEHLNRALVVERAVAESHGFEIVNAIPQLHAGGSFAMTAWANFKDPVLVETIVADAGIDIGGTNLKAGLTDENGRLLAVKSMKIREVSDPDVLADTLVTLTEELAAQGGIAVQDIASVGAGIPGVVDIRTGSIVYTCNLPLRNIPLRKLFKRRLGLHLYVENDANCAALAEYYAGAGQGSKRFVTITLGTGIGAGIIHNGKIFHGGNGMAGEVGHTCIDYQGLPCPCGRRGCWEQYASASALKRFTAQALQDNPDSILAQVIREHDGHVSGQSAFMAARLGDPVGRQVCDMYIGYLAAGIANVVNIFQPDTLAIGGGVSNEADEQLLHPLQRLVEQETIPCSSDKKTRIVKAQLGNQAGIIGAALLGKKKRI